VHAWLLFVVASFNSKERQLPDNAKHKPTQDTQLEREDQGKPTQENKTTLGRGKRKSEIAVNTKQTIEEKPDPPTLCNLEQLHHRGRTTALVVQRRQDSTMIFAGSH
jgi:hypothetical protein